MSHTRNTIKGRTYDSLEATPPEERRLYQDVMRNMGPELRDADGNGIPDIAEGGGTAGRSVGMVVENQILVNGEKYRTVDEMPAEVRALYRDAIAQVGRGPGFTVKREGPTFSIGFPGGGRPTSLPGASPLTPRPIEPSSIEWSLRTALVLLVVVVIAALAAWAFLGR